MHTVEVGWGYMFWVFLCTLFAFWVIDKVDGASRWGKRRETERKQALAEGWRKWHAGQWRIGEQ